MRSTALLFGALLVSGCAAEAPPVQDEAFQSYWFDGTAEISRYELIQDRYGEPRSGDAVLIFVKEDFTPGTQVKADRPDGSSIPVLKMNFVKKFLTGIYPYSIMTSVFTPLDTGAQPKALKTTTSVQEWCGQTFLQWNLRGNRYEGSGYSYFESEGDGQYTAKGALLEDDLWMRVRLQPAGLPTGRFDIVPGSQAVRLLHQKPQTMSAEGVLETDNTVSSYTLRYRDEGRILSIDFEKAFPHRILGWKETVRGKVTEARRTHTQKLDYWNYNGNEDLPQRDRLGLSR